MKDYTHDDAGLCPGETEIQRLGTGTLSLTMQSADREGLYRLAERQNPKRAFLFVSTVLGRHIPVAPSEHRAALQALADKARPHLLDGPVFVMGYAETAVGIGAGVFDCLRDALPTRPMGYQHTTRHPVADEEPWFSIEEGHSHATDHHVMYPGADVCFDGPRSTLVLVDDETTTGTTFAELACALHANGARFGRIVLVTLTDWSDGAAAPRVTEVSGGTETVAVSLMSGRWSWTQDPNADLPALPCAIPAECPEWQPDGTEAWSAPRTGISLSDQRSGFRMAWNLGMPGFPRTDRVLVIGSGEHVWRPFLVAEAFETFGLETQFIATTRSPILPGPVIEHKITFPDHFGLGLPMYLHNVDPAEWDRIVLFVETGIEGVHPSLRAALGKGLIVDGTGRIHQMIDA